MADYHLYSMSIFLHYQIRFSLRMHGYSHSSTKVFFFVLHVHMLIFVQKLKHSLTLGRSASKCM